MNKPLAIALTCFLSAATLTLAMPAQESEAGFRHHCCGRAARTRCYGRHFHRARCHGNYGGHGYYDSGYGQCCGTQFYGCHGGSQYGGRTESYNEFDARDQMPPAPRQEAESSASTDFNDGGVEASSPSDSNNPPPPLTP